MQRAKETLFNMLNAYVSTYDGYHCVDAFAGSGALGIEALSRGASYVSFFENDPYAQQALSQNIISLKLPAHCYKLHDNCLTAPQQTRTADIIFCDPPYHSSLLASALTVFHKKGYIGPNTILGLTTEKEPPKQLDDLILLKQRVSGRCCISIWASIDQPKLS